MIFHPKTFAWVWLPLELSYCPAQHFSECLLTQGTADHKESSTQPHSPSQTIYCALQHHQPQEEVSYQISVWILTSVTFTVDRRNPHSKSRSWCKTLLGFCMFGNDSINRDISDISIYLTTVYIVLPHLSEILCFPLMPTFRTRTLSPASNVDSLTLLSNLCLFFKAFFKLCVVAN